MFKIALAALALMLSTAMPCSAAGPLPADVVKAQAAWADAQLSSLAAIYGADPDGAASSEAFRSKISAASRSYASGGLWPAQGATLSGSLAPILALSKAGRMGCKEFSGPCQDSSLAWASKAASGVRASKNPGKRLAELLVELGL